jgi:two-component system, cell cycle sensor histidine kinase and response regulator CckA
MRKLRRAWFMLPAMAPLPAGAAPLHPIDFSAQGHGFWVPMISMVESSALAWLAVMLAAAGVGAWSILSKRRLEKQTEKVRNELRRQALFSQLGGRLSAASTPDAAARVMVESADELVGWDACSLDLYLRAEDRLLPLLAVDMRNGKRTDVSPAYDGEPSPIAREVMKSGGRLILRRNGDEEIEGLIPFGEMERRSLSLLLVPIRQGTEVKGLLTIQSYTLDAYDREDLRLLQALADFCGGTLDRIRRQQEFEENVSRQTVQLAEAQKLLEQETARHEKAAHELAVERHLSRELLDHVPDHIYFKDRAGRFIKVNRAMATYLGASHPADVLGKTEFDFFKTAQAERSFRDEQRVIESGMAINKEEQDETLDGRVSWTLRTTMALRDDTGAVTGTFGISRDISRRKEIERALAEQQEEYQTIFDSVPAIVLFKNTQNKILRANRYAEHFVGLTSAQMVGKSCEELHAGDPEAFYKEDQEVIRTGKPKLGSIEPLMLPSGKKRWLQADRIPYRDCDGNITAIIVFAVDITDLKNAQDELERRERMLRNFYEGSEDAIFMQDLNGTVLDANPAGCRLHGTSREELIGRSILDLVAPERREEWGERVPQLIAGEQTEMESASYTSDHRAIPVSIRAMRIEHDGRPALLLQVRDISERKRTEEALHRAQAQLEKRVAERTIDLLRANELLRREIAERAQAEQALRQSEARFSKAFRASPVSMGITTLGEGRFIDVNDIFLTTFGFAREEVVGQSAIELGLWLDPSERARLVAKLHEQQHVRNVECRFVTKSGEIRHALVSVEIIELGKQPHLLFITHDVTERLSLEAQLRHSQKMEAVGQLAAGVAHDFNNILTIIQGHANLLLATSIRYPELVDPLGQISGAVDRAANLTRQLLTFSRKQVLQPKLLDISEVVGNATKMLNRLLGENIELQFSYSPSLPPVLADVGMMEQMIINLAVNARDAMPRGGQLTISTGLREIGPDDLLNLPSARPEARPGQFICLAVSDVGCGMDDTTLGRLFEPFFTTKEIGKGTGLGLATVYGIVTQHQGWIEVSSAPGQGTTFSVFLPAVPRQEPEPSPPAKPLEVRGGTETILVVEDEPALRLLVRNVLKRYGYRVLDAAHGKEALTVWKEHSSEINLLLTDMMMPEGISGIELAEMLREENPGLKVIYSSGYSIELLEPNREMTEGVNFVAKPFHPTALAQTVRNCLDS